MKRSDLQYVIDIQQQMLEENDSFTRYIIGEISPIKDFVNIISGIRRCGKSTLLAQLIKRSSGKTLFVNFDNPRLLEFDVSDFRLLDNIIKETSAKELFFDEIQVVPGWEVYVRSKLDEGFQVTVTGSNASMLSRELGTRLTGRHISKELFPFSYSEFCDFKKIKKNVKNLLQYLETGGFPQYVKTKNDEILTTLFEDILYRDIVVRNNIRDIKSLNNLLIYLIGNVGNIVSSTKLTGVLGIKTAKTVLEYFSYFEQSYILDFVPCYSYSYKSQMLKGKKVYCADCGLQNIVSPSSTDDLGRRLENMVYMELRRKTHEIYYYNEQNHECDFVVCERNRPKELYQVCYELNDNNEQREIAGLRYAMKDLNIKEGIILTLNGQDTITTQDGTIYIKPVLALF